jgi:hypothetical protein
MALEYDALLIALGASPGKSVPALGPVSALTNQAADAESDPVDDRDYDENEDDDQHHGEDAHGILSVRWPQPIRRELPREPIVLHTKHRAEAEHRGAAQCAAREGRTPVAA